MRVTFQGLFNCIVLLACFALLCLVSTAIAIRNCAAGARVVPERVVGQGKKIKSDSTLDAIPASGVSWDAYRTG